MTADGWVAHSERMLVELAVLLRRQLFCHILLLLNDPPHSSDEGLGAPSSWSPMVGVCSLAFIRSFRMYHSHLPPGPPVSPEPPGLEALWGQRLHMFPSLLGLPDTVWHLVATPWLLFKSLLGHSIPAPRTTTNKPHDLRKSKPRVFLVPP